MPHLPGKEHWRALAALHRLAAYTATLLQLRFCRRIVAAASAAAIAPLAFAVVLRMPIIVRDGRPSSTHCRII